LPKEQKLAVYSMCRINSNEPNENKEILEHRDDYIDYSDCIGKISCVANIKSEKFENLLGADYMDKMLLLKYSCIEIQENVTDAKNTGLWIAAAMNMLILAIFLCLMYLLQKTESEAYQNWDLSVVTAGDYTVVCKIDKNHFIEFCKNRFLSASDNMQNFENIQIGSGWAKLYSEYLKQTIENEIRKYAKNDKKAEIAQIEFSFPNEKLLLLLMKRSNAIMNNGSDSERKKLLDLRIKENIISNSNLYKIPREAFITFEYEDGYMACIEHPEMFIEARRTNMENKNDVIPLNFELAPEPSDISWEYRGTAEKDRLRSIILAIIIGFVVISVTLVTLFAVQIWSMGHVRAENICSRLNFGSQEAYQDAAIEDWYESQILRTTKKAGIAKCFCNQQVQEFGKPQYFLMLS